MAAKAIWERYAPDDGVCYDYACGWGGPHGDTKHWLNRDLEWTTDATKGRSLYWDDRDQLVAAVNRTATFDKIEGAHFDRTAGGKPSGKATNEMARRMFASPQQLRTSFRRK